MSTFDFFFLPFFQKSNIANVLNNLAIAAANQGDYDAAYPLYQESLQINRDLNDRWMLAYLLENIGYLLNKSGES